MEISGKQVTIIGGQRSGSALAQLVISLGGKAKISEQGTKDCLSQEFKDWAAKHNISLEFNGHTQGFVEDSDIVVLSPGVRFDAPPVQWAKKKDILVLGEVEFSAQFCTKPIIAVTGSNGKTTVSTLIRDVLTQAGHKACLCGNVGSPFAGYVRDLDDIDFIVLEISSFQCESILDPPSPFRMEISNDLRVKGFRPHIAVILNFSQNHLDRHRDLDEYFEAKKRIFINQKEDDFVVLNRDDPKVKSLSSEARSEAVYFHPASNPNHSAVLAVGGILGIDVQHCQEVFQAFQGVEHRLEQVRSLDGVTFINDSKATTAEAALWALKRIDQPILMICGGRDKNIDFSVLAETVQKKVKKMYVIGEARQKIRAAFDQLISLEECDGLEEAVVRAKECASEKDCVLFSPMCTSFDMFSDFEARGRAFKDIVNRLN